MLNFAPTLQEFLDSKDKNCYLYRGPLTAYVRKSKRTWNGELIECFDIARVIVLEVSQKKGHFTQLLGDILEATDRSVFVESIQTEYFYKHLQKIGFQMHGHNNLILVR